MSNASIIQTSTARKGVFCGLADRKGGLKNPTWREAAIWRYMKRWLYCFMQGYFYWPCLYISKRKTIKN